MLVAILLLQAATYPDPLEAGWKGEPVCELLQDDAAIRVLRCSFEPGQGHEWHTHQPHWGYTLEGGKQKITNESGTRVVDVPTGTTWRRDEIISHQTENIGATTTSYIIVEPKMTETD
ncbi:MAG: cupin domain-containing protein [Pseudomonadota bacterium]